MKKKILLAAIAIITTCSTNAQAKKDAAGKSIVFTDTIPDIHASITGLLVRTDVNDIVIAPTNKPYTIKVNGDTATLTNIKFIRINGNIYPTDNFQVRPVFLRAEIWNIILSMLHKSPALGMGFDDILTIIQGINQQLLAQ